MSNPSNYLEERLGSLRNNPGAPIIHQTHSQYMSPSQNHIRQSAHPVATTHTYTQPSSNNYIRQPIESQKSISYPHNGKFLLKSIPQKNIIPKNSKFRKEKTFKKPNS